ncbi:biotin/lipoyl-containing protein, partial [Shewanella sp. 0m-11]
MIKDFILPDIGEGVVECELVEWLVAEGDSVVEDQPIADVMTDKALVQIPAPNAGVITKLHYAKGEIALVHAPLYSVDVTEELQVTPSAASGESSISDTNFVETASVQTSPSVAITAGVTIEEFLLPDIGEGIVECELVEWLVNEGDMVVEDQPIADVMTDKALVQIPAIKNGKISKLHYRKGQLARVHEPLFAIEVVSDANSVNVTDASKTSTVDTLANASVTTNEIVPQGKALASPAVRRLARSLDIDISTVSGSGKNGRVYKEDIERHHLGGAAMQSGITDAVSTAKATAQTVAVAQHAQVENLQVKNHADRVEPIKGVRAVMAKMMMDSVSTIPHFTYCEEFDLTDLVALRESMKKKYSSDELKLTMMPF